MQGDGSAFNTPVFSRMKQPVLSDSPCLKIPASPFMKHLGFGTGVNVYLVERSPKFGEYRSPWAVKKINKKCGGNISEYSKRLSEEAAILKQLNHKNIVGFRTFTRSADGTFCLAMEDGQRSLMSLIEDRTEKCLGPFPVHAINEVAIRVADALAYLHHTNRLLHGDLKSANVLIQGNFNVVKLCDFGVTVKLDDNLIAKPGQRYVGTESWSCKEVLEGGIASNKADIFSYGLILYEMLTLGIPHLHVFPDENDFENHEEFEVEWEAAELEYERSLGTRPPLVDYDFDLSYSPIIELFWVCTHELPGCRPSALQVVEGLHQLESLSALPDPTGKLEF
ncbi:unnamed protein product [Clavelina lepadiformis]|uniref:Protein kinase domain-containing protein n=1 Tax=Clavelina lepadiformis TaxID=159417 RepID=A0ABP0EZV3_CLALP